MILYANSLFLSLHFTSNYLMRKSFLYRFYRIPVGCTICTVMGYFINKSFVNNVHLANKEILYSKKKTDFLMLDLKEGNFIKNHEDEILDIKVNLRPK